MSNDLLGKWAMNLMLINVSTRKYGRAVRLPEGGIGGAQRFGCVQIGGVPPLRGAVGCTYEGMDGCGSVQAGPSSHPDSTASTSRTT